jgi:CMP-N,N'-diacetyllegionaminic acid synthase
MTEILGVIPARGGSKGIPRKNLVLLKGIPLIAHTIAAARGSKALSRLIVSTDDEEIANYALRMGVGVPFMRPPELANDDSPIFPVLQHLLCELKKTNYVPDALVLLQPTSPFRKSEQIDAAVSLFLESNCDTVVSVTEVPHQFHPVSVMTVEEGYLHPFLKDEGFRILRRQDKPLVYARNGPAIIAIKSNFIASGSGLYTGTVVPYIMDSFTSIDIDTISDLYYAEALGRKD